MWVTTKDGQLVNLERFQEVRAEDQGKGKCGVGAIGERSYAELYTDADYDTVKRVLEIVGNGIAHGFDMINLQDLDKAEQAIREWAHTEEGVF